MSNPIGRILIAIFLVPALCLLVFISAVSASPAAPGETRLAQPDGSTFPARAWGDEWSNGYESLDGHTILQDPTTGWWVYAWIGADGSLSASSPAGKTLRVGAARSTGLAVHLRPASLPQPDRIRPAFASDSSSSSEFHLPPAGGDMKILVLLAKFTDTPETYPATYFEQLVFAATGSLKSYYDEVSYGALNLIPAEESCGISNDGVTDWTLLDYAHPNTAGATGEANLQLTKDLLTASDGCIDFASFDRNLDGGLSGDELQVIVVVAGWEHAYGDSSAPSIWAHSSYLDFIEVPSLDDTLIGSYYQQSYYAQIGEIHGTGEDQHPATLGVLAHEFGHLLNWPDLYDIDGTSEGVGRWSIMGSGGWNQTGLYAGDTPAHPDAWLKWYQGWLDPVEVTGSILDARIEQAEDQPVAYLLRPNPNGIDWIFNYHTGRGEYFLVENRQQSLSDAGLPGCGLLVWHVNENRTFDNYANADEIAPLISLDQADGHADLLNKINRGDAGDPFPGSSGNTLFNISTTPNSRLNNGGVSGISLAVDSIGCEAVMHVDLTYHLHQYVLQTIQKQDPGCNTWQTLFSEDFEDGIMDGWTATDENGTEYGEYYPAVSSCRSAQGNQSVWMIAGGADGSQLNCGAYYPDRIIPWLTYGPISTLGETAMRLDFSHWTYIEPAIPFYIFDRHCVWASQDNNVYFGYCFTGDWRGWSDYSFSLKNADGFFNFLDKPQVWLAFSMMSDDFIHFPEGGFVDDISLRRCSSPLLTAGLPTLEVKSGQPADWLTSLRLRLQWPGPDPHARIIGPLIVERNSQK